jgi:hypothetical protein
VSIREPPGLCRRFGFTTNNAMSAYFYCNRSRYSA